MPPKKKEPRRKNFATGKRAEFRLAVTESFYGSSLFSFRMVRENISFRAASFFLCRTRLTLTLDEVLMEAFV